MAKTIHTEYQMTITEDYQEVIITDPSYDEDDHKIVPMKKGEYTVDCELVENQYGEYVSKLIAYPSTYSSMDAFVKHYVEEYGNQMNIKSLRIDVDSGLAGIYTKKEYLDTWESEWYDFADPIIEFKKLYMATDSEKVKGVTVSPGDDTYAVNVYRTPDGLTLAIEVELMVEKSEGYGMVFNMENASHVQLATRLLNLEEGCSRNEIYQAAYNSRLLLSVYKTSGEFMNDVAKYSFTDAFILHVPFAMNLVAMHTTGDRDKMVKRHFEELLQGIEVYTELEGLIGKYSCTFVI